ncbi:MAG: hypothetical protein ACRDRS_04910 [Pseudonocardiaceae bacterium]
MMRALASPEGCMVSVVNTMVPIWGLGAARSCDTPDIGYLLADPGDIERKDGTDVHRHGFHRKSLAWSVAHC